MSNKLTGAIPDLSALTNMNYLYLGFNNFQQSSFPTWLLGMTSLYDIILDNTVMPGTVFPDITRLVHLEYLSLSNCNISGPVTSDIQYLSNLQTLYLDHNDLSGSIPPEIANLKQLTALDLSHNHFEGTVPPAILQMPTYNSQNFQFSDQTPLPSTSSVGNLVYIVIAGGIILVLAIIGFAFYRNNQRKKQFPNYGFQNNQVSPQPLGQTSYPQQVYPNNTAPANLPYGTVPQTVPQTAPQTVPQTAPQTVPQTAPQTAPYQANSVPMQGIQQPINALPMQPVYQTNIASPDAYLQNPSVYQNQNRLSVAGYDQYTQFSSSPIQPIMSPTQTVSSSFASSPIAFQESPNQGVNNYSPQRLSYVPSPQTPVGNDSPHGSQNSNSRISQVSPYQHVQPISAEIGQLPIISPPQSPYADLMSQQEITQPPVIEFQKHESTGLETAKIDVEDQPPLISKPF
ncbi:hypothetical protein HDV04_000802 [Boothiomyces sp. JEL0838]|nr:hypothetical protein HDV04_000802 [Boothiomyces sp. JEL0838]